MLFQFLDRVIPGKKERDKATWAVVREGGKWVFWNPWTAFCGLQWMTGGQVTSYASAFASNGVAGVVNVGAKRARDMIGL